MQGDSIAKERARQAEALMQQVRELGHLPQETESKPEDQLLARQLRDARVNGFLEDFEEELEDMARKDVGIAKERARQAEPLMQQVRELGHLPQESESKPKEQVLARQLRDARANGFLEAFEEELEDMARNDVETSSATTAEERARQVEALMQQVRERSLL